VEKVQLPSGSLIKLAMIYVSFNLFLPSFMYMKQYPVPADVFITSPVSAKM